MIRSCLIGSVAALLAACGDTAPDEPRMAPLGAPTVSPLGTLSPARDAVIAEFITPDWSRHPEPLGDDALCELDLQNQEPAVSFDFVFTGDAVTDSEQVCGIVFAPPKAAMVSEEPLVADASGATHLAFIAFVPEGVTARPFIQTARGRLTGEPLGSDAEPRENIYTLPAGLDLSAVENVGLEVPGGQPPGGLAVRQIAFLEQDRLRE